MGFLGLRDPVRDEDLTPAREEQDVIHTDGIPTIANAPQCDERPRVRVFPGCFRTGFAGSKAVSALAGLLERAQAEHKTWEREHGTDPDWATWYAKFLLGLDVTPERHNHATDPQPVYTGTQYD